MTNQTETVQYQLDADMIGEEFRGTTSDLGDFLMILADVTGRPETDFLVRQHVTQWEGAEEPSEQDWLEALDLFVAARPDLFD